MRKILLKTLCFAVILCTAFSLYACGENGEFTVNFDADGGTLSFDSEKLALGDDIIVPQGEKEGFRLACFIYEYGERQYVFSGKFFFRTDITVKAVWAPIGAYLINYDMNEGAFEGSGRYYYFQTDEDIMLKTPVKRGCRFSGWKEKEEDTPQVSVVIPKGSTGDKTFSAVYEEAEYKVKLILSCETENPYKEGDVETVICTYGGAGEKTLTVPYGSALSIGRAVPIKEGYDFLCWRYYKDGELVRFYAQGENNAVVFNEDNFVYGEEVVLYVYCVPVVSEFV